MKKNYKSVEELPKCKRYPWNGPRIECGAVKVEVYPRTYEKAGTRLLARCAHGHQEFIPYTEDNLKLVSTQKP